MKFSFTRHFPVADSIQLLVGTSKGLVIYSMVDQTFQFRSVDFKGFNVTMLFVDESTGVWWAGLTHRHWGPKLHYSSDKGNTWQEASLPTFGVHTLPDGSAAVIHQLWCMAQTGGGKNRLWLGTDPGGLFESTDAGSFHLNKALWTHPSRNHGEQWFGAGSSHPFIHSIAVDPRDNDHIYIAVSSAGVFETRDGGNTWAPKNNGLKATFLPDPEVEIGHDPHCVLIHPEANQVLWQQNHCGVFVTQNGADEWQDVSPETTFSYGFALAIDETDPAKAWVIPVESDAQRVAPGLALRVLETSDFGATWGDMSQGLPDENVFDIVLRHAFCKKEGLMAFGTNNGNLYFRNESSSEWQMLASHLPNIHVVKMV